jgi:hypothetical protein
MVEYLEEEVNAVFDDIKDILGRFEMTLLKAMDNITEARRDLDGPSGLASLITADMLVKDIDLIPMIDTLDGILDNQNQT